MKRFAKILTTTDLSSGSWAAVQFGAHLAKEAGAKLIVLHVQQSMTIAYSHWTAQAAAEIDRVVFEQVKQETESWVSSHIKGMDVEVVVRTGSVASTITQVAEDVGAELIVMATHGHTGMKHLIMGSVTEHVLRHAVCPVLVVNPTKMEKARKAKKRAA